MPMSDCILEAKKYTKLNDSDSEYLKSVLVTTYIPVQYLTKTKSVLDVQMLFP
jgi:hypothetical protein